MTQPVSFVKSVGSKAQQVPEDGSEAILNLLGERNKCRVLRGGVVAQHLGHHSASHVDLLFCYIDGINDLLGCP